MATSPDFLRIAASSARTLAETALESLSDAVLVVDGRRKQWPVVLANATARGCFADANSVPLIDSPLLGWLAPSSVSTLETALNLLSESLPSSRHLVEWG